MVNNGTKEFKIEAIPLSISVCAKAKRKTGKKLPTMPEMANHFHCFVVTPLSDFSPIKNKKNVAMTILTAPS